MFFRVVFLFLVVSQVLEAKPVNNPSDASAATWRPVVLMHGLLGNAPVMDDVQEWIQADYPGIYVNNMEIGDGRLDSLFMNINTQVDKFAASVAADPNLKNGFNVIGHSQGGLITRAYVERYNNPPVYNLISWAGPQDGVYGVPDLNALCPDDLCPWLDWFMNMILDGYWIDKAFQERVSFAAYWKDPFNLDDYKNVNIFLADINNERDNKNLTYKKHLESLNDYLLIYSYTDDIVVPRESPWFEFYAANSDTQIVAWNQTDQYTEDWLGLKTLHQSNRLQYVSIGCGHMDMPFDVCKVYYDQYTRPLLNNTLS